VEPCVIRTLAPPPPGSRLRKVIAFAHACHMTPRANQSKSRSPRPLQKPA
jgi:hypothetical protein